MSDTNDRFRKTIAIAVNYEGEGEQLPLITAKGQGKMAEQILDLAFDNGVKVRKDENLVEILDAVDVGDEIPLKALSAVTEILAYVYELNERRIQEK